MGRQRQNPDPTRQLAGYKAAVTNERVSGQAKQHAQEEIGRIESEGESGGEQEQVEQQPNPANMKRGLKAAMHNERNTERGRNQAQSKLNAMEHPGD